MKKWHMKDWGVVLSTLREVDFSVRAKVISLSILREVAVTNALGMQNEEGKVKAKHCRYSVQWKERDGSEKINKNMVRTEG